MRHLKELKSWQYSWFSNHKWIKLEINDNGVRIADQRVTNPTSIPEDVDLTPSLRLWCRLKMKLGFHIKKKKKNSPTKIHRWEILNLQTKYCCKTKTKNPAMCCHFEEQLCTKRCKVINPYWWTLVHWVKVSQWKSTPEIVRHLLATLKHDVKCFDLNRI